MRPIIIICYYRRTLLTIQQLFHINFIYFFNFTFKLYYLIVLENY